MLVAPYGATAGTKFYLRGFAARREESAVWRVTPAQSDFVSAAPPRDENGARSAEFGFVEGAVQPRM